MPNPAAKGSLFPISTMGELQTVGHPDIRTPLVSRGLLGQMTSCLLIMRDRMQSLRRRHLLIILLIFAVAVIILQMREETFFHNFNLGSPNPLTPKRSDIPKKTAFEAVSVVSEPGTKDGHGNDGNPNGYSPLHGTEYDRKDPQTDGDGGPQHREKNIDLTVSDQDEEEQVPDPHDKAEKVPSNNSDKAGQDNVHVHKTNAEVHFSDSRNVETANITEKTGKKADRRKDSDDNFEHDKSVDAVGPTVVADKTTAQLSEEDRLANVNDNDAVKSSKTANTGTGKTTTTSESVGTLNETDVATIDAKKDAISNLHTKKLVKDIGYERTKCYSVSGEPGEHTCVPSVVVAGYEKCGTSALYYKLTRHPEIVAHAKWKEHCPTEDSLEAMWSWFEQTPVLKNSTSNDLLLNGCIGIVSTPVILKELQRLNPELRVLVALRNYADWSYSFYGYRCYSGYDEGCEKLEKPVGHGPWKETRNPENFAKLVKEINEAGKSPYDAFSVIKPGVNLYRQWLQKLVDIVGKEAIIIIKQEDLSISPRETLATVADFLGIDTTQFPDEAYRLVSNRNDHPAEISWINETAAKDEISAAINSGTAVLNDTRTLLNSFWKPECEWLRDNFDVHFSNVC